jgi:hypothetical protein
MDRETERTGAFRSISSHYHFILLDSGILSAYTERHPRAFVEKDLTRHQLVIEEDSCNA